MSCAACSVNSWTIRYTTGGRIQVKTACIPITVLTGGMFRHIRQYKYHRAVGMHYGPTRLYRAVTATMIHGLHYEPDYGQRYELHYGPRYRSSYSAIHAGPTTASSHRAVGPADVQRWIHTNGDRGPAPLVPAVGSNGPDCCCWGSDEVCWSLLHCWTGQHGPRHPTTPPGEVGASRT